MLYPPVTSLSRRICVFDNGGIVVSHRRQSICIEPLPAIICTVSVCLVLPLQQPEAIWKQPITDLMRTVNYANDHNQNWRCVCNIISAPTHRQIYGLMMIVMNWLIVQRSLGRQSQRSHRVFYVVAGSRVRASVGCIHGMLGARSRTALSLRKRRHKGKLYNAYRHRCMFLCV